MLKTSLLKTSSKTLKSSSGFTLVEILIVLAILAGLITIGLPRIRINQNNIKKVTRDLSVLSREIRNQARIKQMTHRLVFQMDADKSQYWIEMAPSNVLILSEEEEERISELSEDERPKNQFQKATNLIKEVRELPSNLFIGSVETASRSEPKTIGQAYIYYSAEGLVERAAVQITNRDKLTWTLVTNPLTGRVDIIEKPMGLKDLKIE